MHFLKILRKHKVIKFFIKLCLLGRYRYFTCDDYKIYGNISDTTVRQAFIRNSFEDDVLFDAIAFFLQEGGVYLDIGANYGFHSFGLLPKVKDDQIDLHLFEPNRDCYNCLIETVRRGSLNHVFVHCLALGEQDGEKTFHFDHEETVTGSLGDLFVSKYKKVQNQGSWDSYQVPMKMLDTWLVEAQLEKVRVMKLDTSGYDWNIYQGSRAAFKEGKIQVLFFDLLKAQLKLHGTKSSQILSFLQNSDYELYDSLSASSSEKSGDTFIINNKRLTFSRLNVEKLIEKNDEQDFFPHVHGLAIHSTYRGNLE